MTHSSVPTNGQSCDNDSVFAPVSKLWEIHCGIFFIFFFWLIDAITSAYRNTGLLFLLSQLCDINTA